MANDPPKPRNPRKPSRLSVEQRREVLEQLVLCHEALSEAQIELLDEVFDDIYKALEGKVYRHFQKWGLDQDTAGDLLQSSMLDLYFDLIEHGFPDSLAARVHVIARRKASHCVRDTGRSPESVGLPSSGSEKPRSGPVSDLDRALDRRVMAQTLLALLTTEQRRLFDLVFREEQSFVQAAATLGIPEGTMKSRMLALRKVLVAAAEKFE